MNPQKGIVDPKTSRTGEGFNALLWCEMVADNTPPTTKQLPWRGNHVIPERSYEGGHAIGGSFALSYSHFLEGHLLPRLQRLNQASQVSQLSQTRSVEADKNMYTTSWHYQIGNYNVPPTDKFFKFLRKETNGDKNDSEITYEWTSYEKASDNLYTWEDQGNAIMMDKTDHHSKLWLLALHSLKPFPPLMKSS